MKLFKKLMAVALAGAMALTVLTGCGSVVNQKELFSVIKDVTQARTNGEGEIVQGDGTLAKQAFNLTKTYAENHQSSIKEHMHDEYAIHQIVSDAGVRDSRNTDVAGLRAIVPAGSRDAYYVSCAEVKDYQSKFMTAEQMLELAVMLTEMSFNVQINENVAGHDDLGNTMTIHLYSGRIAEKNYVFMVAVVAAK